MGQRNAEGKLQCFLIISAAIGAGGIIDIIGGTDRKNKPGFPRQVHRSLRCQVEITPPNPVNSGHGKVGGRLKRVGGGDLLEEGVLCRGVVAIAAAQQKESFVPRPKAHWP